MPNRKKYTILIVDDSEMNRSILADMLGDEYDIIEAEDGMEAVAVLSRRASDITLMLLDIVMPRMDGFGVLSAMNANGWIVDVAVIMVSAERDSQQIERAFELGVTDFIQRPFDALIVRRRVVNTIILYAKQKRLMGLVEDQIYENERRSSLMIDILSHIVEFRNGESGLHILHVRVLTDLFLSLLTAKTDKYSLTGKEISLISTASALHDIGKIAIDGAILNKPGRLTSDEFEVMKTHTTVGAEMLHDAAPDWMTQEEYESFKSHTTAGAGMLESISGRQDEELVRTSYEICRWHHERWDGRGYPDGLSGDDIPISAQVVALADVYDALTSPRVYKPAIPHEKAVSMILEGQCGAFNPLLMECLSENAEAVRTAIESNSGEELRQRNLRSISEEALRGEGGVVSQRTLRLLDYERMKYKFYASMSEEIQFEYTVSPHMVTLSEWGAKRLGLPEIIMDPNKSQEIRALMGPEGLHQLMEEMRKASPASPDASLELPLHLDGETRWFRVLTRTVWTDDTKPEFNGALGKVIDIHESRLHLKELEKKASCDPLTGLLNRAGAGEQIAQRLELHPNSKFALAYFDLDHLKTANDVYGHLFGDRVIVELARRLTHSIRGSDIVARIGGDEFLLFLEHDASLPPIIARIFRSLCGKFEQFDITVSMGVAEAGVAGQSFEELFRAADEALYYSKRAGRACYHFYDPSMKGILSESGENNE